MKKETNSVKGITLIALIVTIIVILILASVGTYSGIEAVKTAQLNKFISEMKIMQIQVNNIYDKYKNGEEVLGYTGEDIIANIGKLPSTSPKADNVFKESTSGIVDRIGYRYFDTETIKQLGIEGVEEEFFVNIEKRSIISVNGFEYNGKTYYTMDQIPSSLYNVDYEEKSSENPKFEINCELSGENKYKIKIVPEYDVNIEKWQVKYKLSEESNWNTSDNLEFEIEKAGKYQIQIQNGDIKSDMQEPYLGYITDGLMVHYDGIINTRNGSDGGATAWQDLSGNRNDTIMYNMNSTTGYYEKNGYVFKGNSSYMEISEGFPMNVAEGNTIEVICKPYTNNPFTSQTAIWFGTRQAINGATTLLAIRNDTYNSPYIGRMNTSYFPITKDSIEQNKIVSVVVTIPKETYMKQETSSTIVPTIYKNGNIPVALNKISATANAVKNEVCEIGRAWQWQGENRSFNGKIFAIRAYNRQLSQEEIMSNYEIDAKRFGIK